MSFFENARNQQQMTPDQQAMMRKDISSIKSNPAVFLKQKGYDIPGDMNDPKQITQYLLRSGQIGTNRLQQVMRSIGFPGR